MDAVEQRKPPAANQLCPTRGFISIKGEMLRRLPVAAVDIFVQYESKAPVVLYHRAGCLIDSQQVDVCTTAQEGRFFVRTEDFERFGTRLLASVEACAEDESVPQSERYAALQLALAMEIERSARSIDCDPYVAVASKVGEKLVSWFRGNEVLPSDLFCLARHDFNTFTHVTNVAGYSVILAERLGISDAGALEQIAVGAMLHDIGKRFIPNSILTKPGRLQPAERAIIEMHPARGFQDLRFRPDLSREQLMMVYQHHERIDGSGYPVGNCGNEIHPWAKMLAVVDVFDAMTGIRPYRRSSTSERALDYLRANAGSHFDTEVVQCWSAAMTQG